MPPIDSSSDSFSTLLEQAIGPGERLRRELEALNGARLYGDSSSIKSLVERARSGWKAAEAYRSEFESFRALAQAPGFLQLQREARRYQEQSNSMRAIMESNTRIRETLTGQAEASRRLLERHHEQARFFKSVSSEGLTIRKAVEEATRLAAGYEKLAQTWKAHSEIGAWSQVRSLVETLERATAQVTSGRDALAFGDDESAVQERREAAKALDDIVESAVAQPTQREMLDEILGAIKLVQGTSREKYFWALLIPILASLLAGLILVLVTPVADFYEKRALEHLSPQAEAKAVKQAARESVSDLRLLDGYRFVSAKRPLTVFVSARAKSPTVGHLRFGQTVRVLRAERDFTLVEWVSTSGELRVQGWVFSRYLKRFD